MIAMMIRTLNEEQGIEACIRYHLPYVDYIYVVDGGSTDRTVEKAQGLSNKVIVDTDKHFGDFTTRAAEAIPSMYEWVLLVDTDERFDPDFLRNMRRVIEMNDTTSFRFPRVNLPEAKDYPDYQIRLIKLGEGVKWMNKVHEVPTVEGVLLNKVSCLTVHKYPIVHSERRGDVNRYWWSEDGGVKSIEEIDDEQTS